MDKISKHISYAEGTRSMVAKRRGFDNTPNDEQLTRMKLLGEKVFEPLRKHFNVPIYIHSMFRCLEVNTAIGGSKTSQHMKGEAMDIDGQIFGGITNKQIFDYIRLNLDFDQLIGESLTEDNDYEWIHVSYKEENNRKQILIMDDSEGIVTYKSFVEEK